MFGDPSFITSKAPPGGKSDKKLMGIPILLEIQRIIRRAGQRRELASRLKTIILAAWQKDRCER
jgi:hypothetical protein